MRRYRLLLVSLLAVAGAAATAAAAGSVKAPSCRVVDTGTHAEGVFGHFATEAEAQGFLRVVESRHVLGFQVENDGCGDYEVENDAIDRAQRTAFANESGRNGFEVSWEQSTPPDVALPGYVVAVFGVRPTITAANALAQRAATAGFRYVDIAYDPGGRWRVLEPRIPIAAEAGFRAEVRSARLTVTFARS